MKKPFDQDCADSYLEVLSKIVDPPPSDNVLDRTIVDRIKVYLDSFEVKNPVSIWNFYKHMLDLVVHGSLGSSFIVKLFDLEAFYVAPEGSLSQEVGNMKGAPWRGF
jgi:hypothetical protein